MTVRGKNLQVNLVTDIEVDGIDPKDCPDFCDAFISFACYEGIPMTDEQLEELNKNRDFVYEQALSRIY